MKFIKYNYVKGLVLSCAALGLSACMATNPATGSSNFNLVGQEEAEQSGHEYASSMVKAHGLYSEKPELTAYLTQRVADIVRVSETPEDKFKMMLIDTSQFNASATPGYTVINRGILPFFSNEAELMMVLGHEVGHVTARHMQRGGTQVKLANVGLTIGLALLGAKTNSQQAVNSAAELGKFGATVGLRAFSREHEREADKLGMRYISRLNYAPEEASENFEMMQRFRDLMQARYRMLGENVSDGGGLFSTHPLDEERIVNARDNMREIPFHGDVVNKDRYYDVIDGLAFGSKPEDGVWGHGRYYNTKYRFGYRLPQYWFFPRIESDAMPEAYHPTTKSSLWIEAIKIEPDETAEERLFVDYPMATEVKRIKNKHADIYTGKVVLKVTKGFNTEEKFLRVAVVRPISLVSQKAVGKALKFIFAAPNKIAADKLDVDFMEVLNSYTWLSKTVADGIQPLRVKIHKVKRGESVDSLAKMMPFSVLHEQWFRTLNGLRDDEDVKVGDRVKLIVDPNRGLRI